jgi:hypothetical protein
MQISAEPKGWSDAEVDQLLATTASIDTKLDDLHQTHLNTEIATLNATAAAVATTVAIYALVMLASIRIGWSISPYFLPAPKDLAP